MKTTGVLPLAVLILVALARAGNEAGGQDIKHVGGVKQTSADWEKSIEDLPRDQWGLIVQICRDLATTSFRSENEDFVTFMSRCLEPAVDWGKSSEDLQTDQWTLIVDACHHLATTSSRLESEDFVTFMSRCLYVAPCKTNNGVCEHICTKTTNGHICSCKTGYKLAKDGTSCVDVNECAFDNARCAYKCTNLPGSFYCSCRNELFVLSWNGFSCIAVCPSTFVQTAGSCYKVFSADNEARSAADAAVKCAQEHARAKLVAIGKYEQSIIKNLLRNEDKLLNSWQRGWWTSGIYRPSQQLFQWGTGEYIEDNNENWGLKKLPYEGTCVWILQEEIDYNMWGNYDCDTRSGFICEIILE